MFHAFVMLHAFVMMFVLGPGSRAGVRYVINGRDLEMALAGFAFFALVSLAFFGLVGLAHLTLDPGPVQADLVAHMLA